MSASSDRNIRLHVLHLKHNLPKYFLQHMFLSSQGGRIICSVIGVITLVVGIISGFVTYGANSLVLLNLTSCCFWLGAELFFGGVERTFKPIEEISRDEIKSDEENAK